jgi:hypothetical protein
MSKQSNAIAAIVTTIIAAVLFGLLYLNSKTVQRLENPKVDGIAVEETEKQKELEVPIDNVMTAIKYDNYGNQVLNYTDRYNDSKYVKDFVKKYAINKNCLRNEMNEHFNTLWTDFVRKSAIAIITFENGYTVEYTKLLKAQQTLMNASPYSPDDRHECWGEKYWEIVYQLEKRKLDIFYR